jgi:hypothetical protein
MRSLALAGVLLAPVVVTPTVEAQTAQEIFDRMVAEYDRRAADIDNYTVVQQAMGQSVTMYFEKDMSGDHAIFRVKDARIGSMRSGQMADDEGSVQIWEHLPELMERASYEGRETVDGAAVHVVALNDLDDTEFAESIAPGNADFEPKRGTFFVDTELWVPRRMVFEGRLTMEGKPADVTMYMDMQDYRTVDGLLHPFRTAMRVEGLGEAIDPEMRKQYEEMKAQLAEMPESQRAMVEKMMKGQLEQMEKMMGDDGSMNFEITVEEVRVNAGPIGG